MKNISTKTVLIILGFVLIIGLQIWTVMELLTLRKDQVVISERSEIINKRSEKINQNLLMILQDGGPLALRHVNTGKLNFRDRYGNVNPGIKTFNLGISWSDLFLHIDTTNLIDKTDTVFAMYYVLDTFRVGPGRIDTFYTYAVTMSKRLDAADGQDSIVPMGLFRNGAYRPGEFLLFRPNGFRIIMEPECQLKRALYTNRVQVMAASSPSITMGVNSVPGYPKICMYDGNELMEFYTHNKKIAVQNMSVSLRHGAENVPDLIGVEMVHVPMLICVDGAADMLNDTTYSGSDKLYRNKGLNIGRLCPPACKCN